MKILNVVTHLDPETGGGCTERTRQMSRYLAKYGQEVTVLTTDYRISSDLATEGVGVVALPTLSNRFYVPVLQLNRIKKIIAAADIIHLMGHWSFLNALVYLLLRRIKKSYVVCPAGSLPISGRSRSLKIVYNYLVGQEIIQNADAIILVTLSELPQCEDYGVEPDRVMVIPNGIDPDNHNHIDIQSFRAEAGLGQNPFLLFLGRLNPQKGPDLLVQAFCEALRELSPYHLVVAGPDEGMLQTLQKTVARYGAEARVHFLGYLDKTVKTQAYHAADLVVIPSRLEAMSIVVLESGITGTPVVLTDQCGFNEIAAIGGGEVVPAAVAGLKAAMLRMLWNPQELATQGARLKKFVEDHFLWSSIVWKYLELYRRILG